MSDTLHAHRVAGPVCVVSTLLRVAVNWIAGLILPRSKTAEDFKKRLSLIEESWLLVSSTILLGLSTWVSEKHNDDCSLLSQTGCFTDWPHQKNSTPVTVALAVFLGWYCHCVLKSLVPGIGLHAGLDMVGHHFLTLGLLALAHTFNVQRKGFLILALLNFSSPFMHAAKIMHYGGAPAPLKAGLFILFAAAFALSRCILFPRLLLSIVGAIRERLERGQMEVVLPAGILMTGLLLLQALQFYWMHRIVKVIMQGGMQSKDQRAAAAAPTKPPGASPTPDPASDTTQTELPAPSRAAHISPSQESPDSTAAPHAVVSDDTHPAFVLTELSENVLESPVGGSPRSVGLHRRAKADAAQESGKLSAGEAAR